MPAEREHVRLFRLIQSVALERYLELLALPESADPFDPLRRIEKDFPGIEKELAAIAGGYSRIIESAQALLDALMMKAVVPPAVQEYDPRPHLRSEICRRSELSRHPHG
jgi:hypothetical protein